jgi:hypothetical protein
MLKMVLLMGVQAGMNMELPMVSLTRVKCLMSFFLLQEDLQGM